MRTHILVALDESGSMHPKRDGVIAGFARFLSEQKGEGKLPPPVRPKKVRKFTPEEPVEAPAPTDEVLVSLVKFSTGVTHVCKGVPLAEMEPLTARTYTPAGGTALLDAVAAVVRLADEVPGCDRVLCAVITDGEENASRETTKGQVADLIKAKEATGAWTFTYLGAAPQDWTKGLGGIAGNTMVNPMATPKDTANAFSSLSWSTSSYRIGAATSARSFYAGEDDGTGR